MRCVTRLAWTLVCILAAHLPVTRAAAEPAAILPVAGEQGLATRLNSALGRVVASKGQPMVLGPVEVSTRLDGDPSVAAALARARSAMARAKELELRMDRPAALAAALEALEFLDKVRGALHAPELLLRAHASLVLALLLQPEDPQAAHQAARQLLAVDPGYYPAPGQLSARATLILEEARVPAQRPSPPAARDLGWLATRLGLSRLVWLGVERRGSGRVRLQAVLYDHTAGQVRTSRTQETTEALLLSGSADLVVSVIDGDPLAGSDHTTEATARPWYRRWWVWTIAGAVLAGAGVGIGFAVTSETEDRANTKSVRFHF